MHRVYQNFSPATLKPIYLAITSLYLANKTEDFRVPLRLLIDTAYCHLKRRSAQPLTTYTKVARKIHSLEAMLLMYLGFDKLEGKHPHVIVAKVHQRNELAKDLLECAYVVSINMLLFTDFCLRNSSEVIAAASVQVAATWMKRHEMGYYPEAWLQKFGKGLKFEQIREIADEFIATFNAVDAAIKEEARVMMHKYRLMLEEKLRKRTHTDRCLLRSQVQVCPNQVHGMPSCQICMPIENVLPPNIHLLPTSLYPLPRLRPSFTTAVLPPISSFSHFRTNYCSSNTIFLSPQLSFQNTPPPLPPHPPQTSFIYHPPMNNFPIQRCPLRPIQIRSNAAHREGFIHPAYPRGTDRKDNDF
nr:cyclin [Hymenolepis microstoma]